MNKNVIRRWLKTAVRKAGAPEATRFDRLVVYFNEDGNYYILHGDHLLVVPHSLLEEPKPLVELPSVGNAMGYWSREGDRGDLVSIPMSVYCKIMELPREPVIGVMADFYVSDSWCVEIPSEQKMSFFGMRQRDIESPTYGLWLAYQKPIPGVIDTTVLLVRQKDDGFVVGAILNPD